MKCILWVTFEKLLSYRRTCKNGFFWRQIFHGFRKIAANFFCAFDFAYGAFHSKGGRGILAIASTAKGGTVSRIQPGLTPGAVVSISRNVVDYVVTEYGIAPLRGRSVRQKVRNLIAVAHPDFRAELQAQAEKLMLW